MTGIKEKFRVNFSGFALHEVLLGLICFFLPLYKEVVPLLLGAAVISWLIIGKKVISPGIPGVAVTCIVFYFAHVAGLGYSENAGAAWFNLEKKLSFLILPVFFLYQGDRLKRILPYLFILFIYGAVINGIIGICSAFITWYGTNDPAFFFSGGVTNGIHPTYYSIYLSLGISILYCDFLNPFLPFYSRVNLKRIILLVFLSAMVFLSASKGGFIAFAIINIVFLSYLSFKKRYVVRSLILLVVAMVATVIAFNRSVILRTKIEYAIYAYQMPRSTLFAEYSSTTESSMVRLMIWEVAKEIISENPAGVGTGDVQDELDEAYRKYNMNGALESHLNAHNQYYETAIGIGYHGLLFLILTLLIPLRIALKRKNLLLLLFVLVYAINFFFESILETQTGITHYTLFLFLILSYQPVPVDKKNASAM